MLRIPLLLLAVLAACGGDDDDTPASDSGPSDHSDAAADCDCLAGGCGAAACTPDVVVDGQDAPSSIATDGERLFWSNDGDGTVMMNAIGLRAGDPTMLADGQDGPRAMTTYVRAGLTEVYWVNSGSGEVMRVKLTADGTAKAPEQLVIDQVGLWDVEVTASRLLFVNRTAGEVLAYPLDEGGIAGGVEIVGTGQTDPAWFQCNESAGVFWTDPTAGVIMGSTYSTADKLWSAKVAVPSLDEPTEIDGDGASLYWYERGTGTIMSAAFTEAGLAEPEPFATEQVNLAGFQCNENTLYWGNSESGAILVGTGGDAPVEIATGQGGPSALALVPADGATGASLTWTNQDAGEIVQLNQ